MQTIEEIQNENFPDNWKIEPCRFVSQEKGIEVRIPGKVIPSKKVFFIKDSRGNMINISQLTVGQETIKFNGHEFNATNTIQVEALEAQPNVIRIGDVVILKKEVKEVKDGKADEARPSRERAGKRPSKSNKILRK